MLGFIIRRFLLALVTIWAISIISFLVIQLPPGDFVDAYIAQLSASGSVVSLETAQNIREQYGVNDPLHEQYLRWIQRMVNGDFGVSIEFQLPVMHVIGDRLWLTMIVSVGAILITWGVALPIGIYSAVNQYSAGDYVATFIGFIGLAIPNFLLALILMYFGAKWFGLNVGGLFSPEYALEPWSLGKIWDLIKHLPLPILVLGLAGTAQLIRIMRANLLDELHKPYVVTARAKGFSESGMILKYPVRAALNPFVSTLGYLFPFIVSGSIIVSVVLSLPTVGPVLLRALVAQDMFLAGTIVLLLGIMTVIGTFISDLLLMWVDPRIRLGAK
jgi:peptide/nickel transport system permease protein